MGNSLAVTEGLGGCFIRLRFRCFKPLREHTMALVYDRLKLVCLGSSRVLALHDNAVRRGVSLSLQEGQDVRFPFNAFYQ